MASASRPVSPSLRVLVGPVVLALLTLAAGPSARAQAERAARPEARAATPADVRPVAAGPAPGWEAPPARPAAIQPPRLREVESAPGRVVYAVETTWGYSLAEAAREARAPETLPLAAVGGWLEVSATVVLPAAVPPALEVLSVEADEVALPAGAGAAVPDGPAAEVASVGFERGRPAGTLVARLLSVDAERGVLRRVRRMVVAVRFPEAPPALRAGGGANPHLAVTRSVLADGTWFEIPVAREGVYRIDRAYLQALLGEGTALPDPARLQIYGNGGRPLPALNGAPRPADLVENPTLVLGGGDGSFDEGDALLFFAEGPAGWDWTGTGASARWAHWQNPFTRTASYFLRVDAPSPRRVEGSGFPGWGDAAPVGVLEGRVFRDDDRNTVEFTGGGSGLTWLGAELSASRPAVTVLDTVPPNLVAGTVRYVGRVGGSVSATATLTFLAGGAPRISVPIPPPVADTMVMLRSRRFEEAVAPGGRLRVDLQLAGGGGSPLAWPDWVEAVYPQAPRPHEGLLRFATPGGQAGRFEVALEGFAAEPEVWDVTEPGAIRRLGTQADGAGRFRVQVEVADATRPRELVAFERTAAAIGAPPAATPVENQNLHGVGFHPDYVIVTPAEFRAAADELAAYRQSHDGLTPLVVEVEDVFNEFSGGHVDMRAVRDYFKFLYDRALAVGAEPFRYGLLFGDGHFDYRGITPEGRVNNYIPVFETVESFHQLYSYTSDDYYALLDDNEGVWAWTGGSTFERVDVGIGRIPARSAAEAAAVVRKLRRYESAASLGGWRTRMTMLADDGVPGTERDLFPYQSELVANAARATDPGVDLQKVYAPAYPAVVTAEGRRIPAAAAEARRAVEEGTLVWNYIGHGGPEVLGDERYLTVADVEAFENLDRLPVFVTATCSFGRFDLTAFQSGAELLVLNPNGGAIAAMTTVRLVFAGSVGQDNLGLNLVLTREMFSRDADDRPRRLGDIYHSAKASNVGRQGNNRKFSLLGDPAMRLGLPERPVAITSVNGVALPPPEGAPPAFRALEEATITGQVLGLDGQPDAGFDGEVELLVYDAERAVALPPGVALNIRDGTFNVRAERLFRGRASVRGGAFQARFVVPQDVSYSGRPARVVAYARRGDGSTSDGAGYSEEVVVATTAGPPLADAAGPRIGLFLNDTTFVGGGLAPPEPVLVVRLRDDTGINAVGSGVGHELLLVLDGDEAGAQGIGRFFEGDLDDSRAGTVRVPLRDLAPGPHTARVTAWDVANNPSTAELAFVISDTDALTLRNAYNYPNPTPGPTRFMFEHNQPPGTTARVRLRVYTLAGRPVLTLDGDQTLPGGVLPGGLVQIAWDGRDEDLDALATGVYLWHLRVEVDRPDGSREVAERVERLAVIR